MRAGLRDGSVPVDADWLHDIAGETHLVAPACFEAFATGRTSPRPRSATGWSGWPNASRARAVRHRPDAV